MPLTEPGPYQAPEFVTAPALHRYAKGHSASKTRVNALMALRCVRGTASFTSLKRPSGNLLPASPRGRGF
jgi:hypothetical protein